MKQEVSAKTELCGGLYHIILSAFPEENGMMISFEIKKVFVVVKNDTFKMLYHKN